VNIGVIVTIAGHRPSESDDGKGAPEILGGRDTHTGFLGNSRKKRASFLAKT